MSRSRPSSPGHARDSRQAQSWAETLIRLEAPLLLGAWSPLQASNSQDLWVGVLRGLLIASCLVGSFDEFAVGERGSGADEGDELGCVHGSPAGLADSISLNAIATPAARDPGLT